MQEKKDGKILIPGVEARTEILKGAHDIYKAVVATLGPKGQNVSIEKTYGFPLLTRDGVTVAKEVYFTERPKNQGAQYLYQASEVTNKVAGDGTTQTVALAYHLLNGGYQMIGAGTHPMTLKTQILADSELLLKRLPELTTDAKEHQLEEVATVSSGDPLLGKMIAEAIQHVGPDGGVITEKAMITTPVEREYISGYYLQSGFTALQAGRKEMSTPITVVLQKRLTSHADAISLLNGIATAAQVKQGEIMSVLIIGNVEEQAYHSIVQVLNQRMIDAIIVKPPLTFGEMSRQLLEDIAIYAACEPITESVDIRSGITVNHLGRAIERVVATKSDATLFAENDTETIEDRVKLIKEQIEAEEVDAIAEKLRSRVANLEGKVAIFRIGGATDTAKEELEFRVEDSILATRAAVAHGVVPGGGITLLELSKTEGLSPLTRDSLREVFKQLLINANLPEQVKLDEALKAKFGMGYNLRKSDDLVDLVKSGILDPALVVENIIRNACEMTANVLSIGMMIVHEEKGDPKNETTSL